MPRKKSWVLLLYEENQESFLSLGGLFWWNSKLGHVGTKQVCKSLVLLQQASVLEQMAFSSSLVWTACMHSSTPIEAFVMSCSTRNWKCVSCPPLVFLGLTHFGWFLYPWSSEHVFLHLTSSFGLSLIWMMSLMVAFCVSSLLCFSWVGSGFF